MRPGTFTIIAMKNGLSLFSSSPPFVSHASALAIGFFLALAVHHLALYIGGRRKAGDIAFSLLEVFVAVRVAVNCWTPGAVAPSGSFWGKLLDSASFFPLLPLFTNFVNLLFPKESKPRVSWAATAAAALFFVVSLVVPASIRPVILIVYAPVIALILGMTVGALATAIRGRRSSSAFLMAGALTTGLVLELDLTMEVGWLPVGSRFLFAGWAAASALCSAGMGKRIQDAYDETARVSLMLEKYNDELEAVVEERTRELRTANEDLRRMVETDALTGIANRRKFESALEEERRRAARKGSTLSVGMFDVDYFKYYNDTYGHVAGDACLRRVAAALASHARRPGDLAARYGGEEFALLLPETDREGALATVKAAVAAIEKLNIPHEGSPFKVVTISAGIACVEKGQGDVVTDADRALYAAKAAGRNSVREAVGRPENAPGDSRAAE